MKRFSGVSRVERAMGSAMLSGTWGRPVTPATATAKGDRERALPCGNETHSLLPATACSRLATETARAF